MVFIVLLNIFMIYLIKVIYRNKTPPLTKDAREGINGQHHHHNK